MTAPPAFLDRGIADARNREAWLAARVGRFGASDAAAWAKLDSWPTYMRRKQSTAFAGNAYTQHGHAREPHMLRAYGFEQNHTMFTAAGNPLHTATPDGWRQALTGQIKLAECKTSTKPMPETVPANYLRQMQWQMHVLDADACLLIWEHHVNMQPVAMEPDSVIVLRDQQIIDGLVLIADRIEQGMRRAAEFTNRMENLS